MGCAHTHFSRFMVSQAELWQTSDGAPRLVLCQAQPKVHVRQAGSRSSTQHPAHQLLHAGRRSLSARSHLRGHRVYLICRCRVERLWQRAASRRGLVGGVPVGSAEATQRGQRIASW